MIVHKNNIISDIEIDSLYEIWFNPNIEHGKTEYKYALELIDLKQRYDLLNINYIFDLKRYRMFFLQCIDVNHNNALYSKRYHNHRNTWTYVLYLNDNYDGGELEFESGEIIKPKKGDLIYFSPNEFHRVLTPYNFKEKYFIDKENKSHLLDKRYSLVGFMNTNVFDDTFKTTIL